MLKLFDKFLDAVMISSINNADSTYSFKALKNRIDQMPFGAAYKKYFNIYLKLNRNVFQNILRRFPNPFW